MQTMLLLKLLSSLMVMVTLCSGIKIGYLGPEDYSLSATRLAIDDINADTALLPSNTLELISNTSITVGTNLTNFEVIKETSQLVSEGVVAVVGFDFSSVAKPASLVAQGLGVPLVSGSATSPVLSDEVRQFFYRTIGSDTTILEALGALMIHYQWFKFSMSTTDDSFGWDGANVLQRWANGNQRQITALKFLPLTATSNKILGLMNEIAATHTFIHVQHLYGAPATLAVSAAHSAGLHKKGTAMLATWMSGPLIRQKLINDAAFSYAMAGYIVTDFKSYTENGGQKGTDFKTRWEGLNSTLYPGAGICTYDVTLTSRICCLSKQLWAQLLS